jgi:hypothetical protein
LVQPTTERLANVRGPGCEPEVKTGPGAHQAAGCVNAVGPDQALTSQSLQQVVEGLMHLKNEEMKHWFKDWLVFDSQVIHYIA